MIDPKDLEVLQKYGKDLTDLARKGKLDPVVGRDDEIRRVMQILSRRRKNNPALIGEPGVGKTAIVEGLAFRIIKHDVPSSLKDRTIFTLDMGQILAGAKHKGEFEERLNEVVKILDRSNGEIIAFFDELHNLVRAGAGESSMGAGNILKPALARGEIRCIGATTLDEYRENIEKDPALERRFQPIVVKEPSVEDTITILRGIKEAYSLHHGLEISDEALISAANLSNRYIRDRFLPDKAIDLIDEACSSIKMQIDSKPKEIDSLERKLKLYQIQIARGGISPAQLAELSKESSRISAELDSLVLQWEAEKEQHFQVQTIRLTIDELSHEADQYEIQGDLSKVAEIRYGKIFGMEQELQKLETALSENRKFLREKVSEEDIASIVQGWTGIPVNKLLSTERKKLLTMDTDIKSVVIGQDKAVNAVCKAVRRSRAGVGDPNKPVGTFLFVGSSGTGKTELSKSLANFLFDDEKSMIRLDMSEYMEKHSVSKMIGSPPGYAGHEAGGQLTEAVRRNPYSVILLDEIEKAHPDVMNILLQVLDEGRLTDSRGKVIDFRQSIVIMTSNIGSEILFTNDEDREQKLNIALRSHLRPEFLNRIDETVLFNTLGVKQLGEIVKLNLKKFSKRIEELAIKIKHTDEVCERIAEVGGMDPAFGARPIKRILQKVLEDELGMMILEGKVGAGSVVALEVDADSNTITLREA